MILGVLAGSAAGSATGCWSRSAGSTPFIATLATAIVVNGLAQVLTSGNLVSVEGDRFIDPRARHAGSNVNYSGLYVWLAVVLVCGFLLSLTTFGRYVYAAGGNAEAARLSGVRVNVVRADDFAISGLCRRDRRRDPRLRGLHRAGDAGSGIEFDAIAAIVLGGDVASRRRGRDLAHGARRPASSR